MKTKRYDQEFKEQIVRECQEVGNVALVARRHSLSKNTVHSWLKASRTNGPQFIAKLKNYAGNLE